MTFEEWFDAEGFDEQHRQVLSKAWEAGQAAERERWASALQAARMNAVSERDFKMADALRQIAHDMGVNLPPGLQGPASQA